MTTIIDSRTYPGESKVTVTQGVNGQVIITVDDRERSAMTTVNARELLAAIDLEQP